MPTLATSETMVPNTSRQVPPLSAKNSGLKTWDDVADWHELLFDFALNKAKSFGDAGRFDDVLQWCSLAAWFASRQGYSGRLSSRELELELLRAAKSLAIPQVQRKPSTRRRWLHVINEAYGTLGHTNLCRRWIEYSADDIHDLVLLEQEDKVPENLLAAAKSTEGLCLRLDITSSPLERAAALRARAWEYADVVVLHTHPEDVIATAAFGVAGGPPVLLVNHADHSFWVGCSVAELVLDIRDSGHFLTRQARGVERAALLPLPLEEIGVGANSGPQKQQARKKLGIPEGATLLLTVGSAVKFRPVPGLNFVQTAQEIVAECEGTYLIAVGPKDEGDWKAARKATDGRIRAVGPQPATIDYCRAADIYLEGFPTGSLTALLEACLAGLPCVRSPRECVPPFCSDDLALCQLPQPTDLRDYVAQVKALIGDRNARIEQGRELQRLTKRHHCQQGWLEHLRDVQTMVPSTHTIYPDFSSAAISHRVRNWFLRYLYFGAVPSDWTDIAVPFFLQSWKRANTPPVLNGSSSDLSMLRNGLAGSSLQDATAIDGHLLHRLNRKVSREGKFDRLLADANRQFKLGDLGNARKLTYRCLSARFSAIIDMKWWKLFSKTHGGYELRAGLRKVRGLSRRTPLCAQSGAADKERIKSRSFEC